MTEDTHDRRDHRFWIGLLAGTAVGAGLAMWVLPRASAELRQRMTTSARSLRTAASDLAVDLDGCTPAPVRHPLIAWC